MSKSATHHPGQYITVLYFMMGMAMCSFYIHVYQNNTTVALQTQNEPATGADRLTETITISRFMQ